MKKVGRSSTDTKDTAPRASRYMGWRAANYMNVTLYPPLVNGPRILVNGANREGGRREYSYQLAWLFKVKYDRPAGCAATTHQQETRLAARGTARGLRGVVKMIVYFYTLLPPPQNAEGVTRGSYE